MRLADRTISPCYSGEPLPWAGLAKLLRPVLGVDVGFWLIGLAVIVKWIIIVDQNDRAVQRPAQLYNS